jgi:hypothetical protein
MPTHKQALTTFGHMTPVGRFSTGSLRPWGLPDEGTDGAMAILC